MTSLLLLEIFLHFVLMWRFTIPQFCVKWLRLPDVKFNVRLCLLKHIVHFENVFIYLSYYLAIREGNFYDLNIT